MYASVPSVSLWPYKGPRSARNKHWDQVSINQNTTKVLEPSMWLPCVFSEAGVGGIAAPRLCNVTLVVWACRCWAFCTCHVCTFPVLCRSAVVLPLFRGFTCCSVSLLLGAQMCSRPSSLWYCSEYLWYLMLQIRFPVMALWSLEGARSTHLWVSKWHHKFPDLQ